MRCYFDKQYLLKKAKLTSLLAARKAAAVAMSTLVLIQFPKQLPVYECPHVDRKPKTLSLVPFYELTLVDLPQDLSLFLSYRK